MLDFELDPAKERGNRAKHGIDFDAAQSIRSDPRRIETPKSTARQPGYRYQSLDHTAAVLKLRLGS